MQEHPERRRDDDDVERERRESTDLGYRDTDEERAYERAESEGGNDDPDAEDTEAG